MQNEPNIHAPSLSKSSIALLSSNYGVALFNVAFSMILLRLLSRTEYAVVAVLEILTSLMTFTTFGLNTVFLQLAPAGLHGADDRTGALGLIKLALYFRFALLLLAIAGIAIFADSLSNLFLKTTVYGPHLRLLAVGAVANAMLESFMHIAQAAQEFRRVSRWTFWTNVLRSPTGLLFFSFFGLWGYLAGVVWFIVMSTAGIGWTLRGYWLNSAPLAPLWKTLRYGIPYFIRGFSRFGFLQLDQLLVGILLKPDALAIYSVARRFTGYISQATEAFLQPVLMRAAALRDGTAKSRSELHDRAMRYVPMLLLPLCLGVAVSSPWLMRIVGGDQYAAGWPVLVLLCLAQVAGAFFGMSALFVFAMRPPWTTLLLDTAVGAINLIVAPLAILSLGLSGIALGQMLGFAVGCTLGTYLLRSYPELRMSWTTLRRLVVPLTLFLSVVAGGQALYSNPWVVPVYLGMGATLFMITLGMRLENEEWERIRSLLPGRLTRAVCLFKMRVCRTARRREPSRDWR